MSELLLHRSAVGQKQRRTLTMGVPLAEIVPGR
jgi:hypothetical protein